ncbi:MAG: single-stranded DNA-binding protein [Saprospiraceae bacterium]
MVNKVILVGRLGKDPDVRRLESGAAVAKFSLATNEYYKDKEGNKVEQSEWHQVIAWRSQAEFAEKYLRKGMLVYVEGKLTHRDYTDKDGIKRYITEVVLNNIQLLERKDSGSSSGYFPPDPDAPAKEPAPTVEDDATDAPEGDLPF